MKKTGSEEAEVPAVGKSDKMEPEKGNGDDYELSQLRDEESLETIYADKEYLNDQAVRETLAKDQVEGVRENSAVEPNGEVVGEVKGTNSLKKIPVSTIVPVCEVAVENCEVETSPSDPLMLEPSLSSDPSAAQCLSLVSVPTTQEQRSNSRVVNTFSVSPVLRTPARDGYNWRKYGQKQVKSPKGSRSYYRCTYSKCYAKKIERSNDSGNVIEIVNKGLHSHEPHWKNNFSPREIRVASAITPVIEDKTVVQELALVPSGSDSSTSTKENICVSQRIVERKRHYENEAVEVQEPKRRLKKDNSEISDPVSKPGKKQRFVVHAAGDVGIAGDGYRWRKYGQKMVKGNPNPRNYYRCTSAACPVRKHIETAVENTTALIITYKGVHSHDKPVPKKRHGPSSSMLVTAAAPTSMRTRQDDQVNVLTTSECPVELEGESEKRSSEVVDVSGEKVMESARTLLSIGFEC